jgi:hypothetical protein
VEAIACAAGAGPALVVLDDLHWADAESLAVWQRVATAPGLPALVVGVFRPEDFDRGHALARALPELERQVRVGHVSLDRLDLRALGRMLEEAFGVTEDTWREGIAQSPHFAISETPTFVARGVAALAADPERKHFSGQTLTSFQMAQRYDLTDIDGSRPDAWRYITEVEHAGKPADTTGYR